MPLLYCALYPTRDVGRARAACASWGSIQSQSSSGMSEPFGTPVMLECPSLAVPGRVFLGGQLRDLCGWVLPSCGHRGDRDSSGYGTKATPAGLILSTDPDAGSNPSCPQASCLPCFTTTSDKDQQGPRLPQGSGTQAGWGRSCQLGSPHTPGSCSPAGFECCRPLCVSAAVGAGAGPLSPSVCLCHRGRCVLYRHL